MFYPEQSRSVTLEQMLQSGLSSGLEEPFSKLEFHIRKALPC
jgi:hypothetical protein